MIGLLTIGLIGLALCKKRGVSGIEHLQQERPQRISVKKVQNIKPELYL